MGYDITTFFVFSLPLLLIFEHALPPSLNLNHNAYSTFPRIHVERESMERGAKVDFDFARAQLMNFTVAFQLGIINRIPEIWLAYLFSVHCI